MTVTRTMDGRFLTEVANHPDVRPWLGGEGPLDLTAVISNPENYALVTDGGGWVIHKLEPGVYELHSLFLPGGRGKPFFAAAREMFRFMFTRTEATEILTKCPDDNPGARMAASLVGFKERFRREDAWAPGVGVSYQAFTIDQWATRDPEALVAGRAFHDALQAAKTAAGVTLPPHPDDEAHDRAAGSAWLIVNAGQTLKGVGLYNRWGCFAGYARIEAVGHQTVDIGEAIVEIRDGTTHVLLVRPLSDGPALA